MGRMAHYLWIRRNEGTERDEKGRNGGMYPPLFRDYVEGEMGRSGKIQFLSLFEELDSWKIWGEYTSYPSYFPPIPFPLTLSSKQRVCLVRCKMFSIWGGVTSLLFHSFSIVWCKTSFPSKEMSSLVWVKIIFLPKSGENTFYSLVFSSLLLLCIISLPL